MNELQRYKLAYLLLVATDSSDQEDMREIASDMVAGKAFDPNQYPPSVSEQVNKLMAEFTTKDTP